MAARGGAPALTLLAAGLATSLLFGCGGDARPAAPGANATPAAGASATPLPCARLASASTGRFAFVSNLNANSLSVFTIDRANGGLIPVPGSPFTTGSSPRGLTDHPGGRFLYVPNFTSETISTFAVEPDTGRLQLLGNAPASGLPQMVVVDPSGRFAYAAIWGLARVAAYSVQASGSLAALAGSPFAGPSGTRSLAVSPCGGTLYAAGGGQLWSYSIDTTTGALRPLEGSPIATGGSSADSLVMHPTGRMLFLTNLGTNNVSAFSVDPGNGLPAAASGSPHGVGPSPQGLALDPAGRFLYVATRGSNAISAFAVGNDASLRPLAGSPFAASREPVAIGLDPCGAYAYVASYGQNRIELFAVDATSGALIRMPGAEAATSIGPAAVLVAGGPCNRTDLDVLPR